MDNLGEFRKYIGSPSSKDELRFELELALRKDDLFQDLYEASEVIAFRKSQSPKSHVDFLTLGDLLEYDSKYQHIQNINFKLWQM